MTSDSPSVYCDCTPIAESDCDSAVTACSDTVLTVLSETLAAATGRPFEELPPLYDVVDPDAIDQLFDRQHVRNGQKTAVLSFNYLQWNIFVRSDGHIRVCDTRVVSDVAPVFDKPMR